MANDGFSADERAAMKERAAELRAEAKREKGAARAAAELQDVLDAIAKLDEGDRAIAARVHELVTAAAPQLAPRTWYGMPAYALEGKVVCFFKAAGKFDARYGELGFNDPARLDDGSMWPTVFAITAIGPAEEKRITELVERAVGR
ncbi:MULTISPECIES: iron chaperone [unclassified Microcella]|uniref:iron chaperone n=1 Tax=unclassified Microcella TaxID=2630066 RepID=UPI0006F2532A|nr:MULTISPECIES: DUF1801 domain-containing protein [unclassified Microcella]KQV25769.1 hypothetical protein ASC54_01955 [Yonghaparkia sp. Root332]KRF33422.1 hypothetical protein ASG83_05675 [Yonghaparkia sp. Soil809]